MKTIKEISIQAARDYFLVDLIGKLLCKYDKHIYYVPERQCGTDKYKRHGVRCCKRADCEIEDHLTINNNDGSTEYIRRYPTRPFVFDKVSRKDRFLHWIGWD